VFLNLDKKKIKKLGIGNGSREGGIAVRNFPQFPQFFPQFPQFFRNFPQFFRNFPQFFLGGATAIFTQYLIPQFSEGVQNHNMLFKIHNYCF
jgi:hypothetical protein